MVSCCKFPCGRSFVLEVRSWPGHNVLLNLHQTNASLCSDKKGQGPKAQLSLSEVQAPAKRRGSLRGPVTLPGSSRQRPRPAEEAALSCWRPQARSPDGTQPSSPRESGAQDPAGPQAPQATQTGPWGGGGGGLCTETQGDCRHRQVAEAGMGRGSPLLQA